MQCGMFPFRNSHVLCVALFSKEISMNRSRLLHLFVTVVLLGSASFSSSAQTLSPEIRQKIDKIATDALNSSGVPSVSVAVVTNGSVAYVQAYEAARLRSGHEVAVQQHQLRDRRCHYREGGSNALASVSARESFHAARYEERDEHRSGQTRGDRSDWLPALRARAVACCTEGGQG